MNQLVALVRYGLYASMLIFSMLQLVLGMYKASPVEISIFITLFLVIGGLLWKKSIWGLATFVVSIPIISGLHLLDIISRYWPSLTLFSFVYLTWAIKRVVTRNSNISPKTSVGWLCDIFGLLIIVSMINVWSLFPLDVAFSHFKSLLWLDQNDYLFSLYAGMNLLSGIFLLRMFELEYQKEDIKLLSPLIYGLFVGIALFSTIQLITNIPPKLLLRGANIFSPFQDIHSYSSVVSLLFFVFLIKTMLDVRLRTINFICCLVLGLFLLISFSRGTHFAVALVATLLLWNLKSKRVALIFISCIIAIFVLMSYIPHFMPPEKYPQLNTAISWFSDDTSVFNRLSRWRISLEAVGHFLPSGFGVGSYYSTFPAWASTHPLREGLLNVKENAHNYYIQLLYELGIPGFGLFIALVGLAFLRCIRYSHYVPRWYTPAFLSGVGSYSLTLMTGHSLLIPNQMLLFTTMVAIMTIPWAQDNSSGKPCKIFKWRYFGALLLFLCVLLYVYGLRNIDRYCSRAAGLYHFYQIKTSGIIAPSWTMDVCSIRKFVTDDILRLELEIPPQALNDNGLGLELSINNNVIFMRRYIESGFYEIDVDVIPYKGKIVNVTLRLDHVHFSPWSPIVGPLRPLGVGVIRIFFM